MPEKNTPALRYLRAIGKKIRAVREDLPHLCALGETMALPLLAGGNLFAPPVAPWWPHEFGNRAGGLMGLRPADYAPKSGNDVAYFALPDPRTWKPAEDKLLTSLMRSKAQLFVNGRAEDLAGVDRKRFAGFTGGAETDEGFCAFGAFKPFAPLRPFEQFVRGWTTAGEMIAAMTRAGKMPIIWMSVWLEGAFVRNASFVSHNNLREPWSTPLFHERHYVPPLAAGRVATEFLDVLSAIHRRLMEQAGRLAQAGRWLAQAHRAGKKLHTIAVGHSYPQILNLPEKSDYPFHWSRSLSDLNLAVPRPLGKGDVALHLGYAPVDVRDVCRILDRGVRFIYSSPFGRPADLKDHENLLWLDLPWRPADATVDVPGYSVRILPMSSSTHTMAYFAIACEFAAAI